MAVLKRVIDDNPRPIPEIIDDVPEWLCSIIGRLQQKNADARPASASEVTDLLERCLTDLQNHRSVQLPAAYAMPSERSFSEKSEQQNRAVASFDDRTRLIHAERDATVGIWFGLLSAGAVFVLALIAGIGFFLFKSSPKPSESPDVTVSVSADSERVAAERVLALGGMAGIDGNDREFKAVAELPQQRFRLTAVELNGSKKVTDAELAVFQKCRSIVRLNLGNTRIGNAGLAHFRACQDLYLLGLHACAVNDDGLALFRECRKLTHLYLSETRITNSALGHVQNCTELRHLWLVGTKIDDGALPELRKFQKLVELNVRKTKIGQVTIDELKKALPKCRIEWDGGIVAPAGKS